MCMPPTTETLNAPDACPSGLGEFSEDVVVELLSDGEEVVPPPLSFPRPLSDLLPPLQPPVPTGDCLDLADADLPTGSNGEALQSGSLSMNRKGSCRLRGIRVRFMLKNWGETFRYREKDSYKYSEEVAHLGAFLSHSWQSSSWAKVCTISLHYNLLPSFLSGLVFAALVPALCPVEFAPELEIYNALGIFSGFAVLLLALFHWPCRELVFLDKACIDQSDRKKKREGIMSLGYFLSNCSTMVVLWDATYFTRLWCVFELAASLKLRGTTNGTSAASLVLLPLSHGVITVALLLVFIVFITLSRGLLLLDGSEGLSGPVQSAGDAQAATVYNLVATVVLTMALAHEIRKQGKEWRSLVDQVHRFSIQNAQCKCCSVQHVDSVTKESIVCDRVMIQSCVQCWFGSTDAFDHYVQETAREKIRVRTLLPYRYVIFGGSPFMWEGISGFIWLLKHGEHRESVAYLSQKILIQVLVLPLFVTLIFTAFGRSGRDPPGRCGYAIGLLLRTLATGLFVLPLLAGLRVLQVFLGQLAYFVILPLFGGLTCLVYRRQC
mmetsp:Transcript_26521/g.61864  ORF Transcript_26521/g.61864 Transcript_26521/m.61864 type:complete len:550 (-) Transcript_26521:264-1913(-)